MKPVRTSWTDTVYQLPGGTEENDLPVHHYPADENTGAAIASIWQPTDAERAAIANGENIELTVWGEGHPPVALRTVPIAAEVPA